MNQLFPVQVLDPPEVFLGGFDTTRNPRALSAGVGVVCDDIELRRGRFEPRPDPTKIRVLASGDELAYSGADMRLFASLPSSRGDVVMFSERRDDGKGRLIVVGRFAIEGHNSPTCAFRDVIQLRGDGGDLITQTVEPMEYARFGNVVYVVNCGVASGDDATTQNATYAIDLRDLKAEHVDWPKARRIENVMGYVALGDLPDRGPLAVVASTLPLVAEDPEFSEVFVEVPGDPDDRVMKIVYFPPGGTYVFLKRAVWRLFNAPPMWGQEKILDVGTLAPETVRVLDGYIYFLGHDGIPYRTTGRPREVERLGAFDRQGRMLSLDLRSPIETSLRRDYHLAGGGNRGVHGWASRVEFEAGRELIRVEYDGGLRLTKTDPVTIEHNAGDTVDERNMIPPRPSWIPLESSPDEAWQSWRRVDGANSFMVSSIKIRTRAWQSPGEYKLKMALYEHVSDDIACRDLVPIKTVEVTEVYTDFFREVEFPFDNLLLEWPDDVPPKQYRIAVWMVSGPPNGRMRWFYGRSDPYPRGRGSYTGYITQDIDYDFRVLGSVYSEQGEWVSQTTDDVGVTRWGTINWRAEEDLPDNVTLTVVATGCDSAGYPIRTTQALVNGQSLDGLLGQDATRVSLWVILRTAVPNRHLSPTLYGIYVHYETGVQTPNAEPTAFTWDGRYCLNLLHRTDKVKIGGVDYPTRDTMVWDREAWSRWRGLGLMRGDVLYDEFNRPRLIYADMLEPIAVGPSANAYRILLLSDRRLAWRGAHPRFQTGDIRLASRWTGQIDEVQVDYTDLGQMGKLYIAFQLDNGKWYAHNIDLLGDNKSHTSVLEPAVREGRILRVVIGENKVAGRSGDRQVPVIVDGLVLVARGAVPRYGVRDTGDRRRVAE